MPLPEMLPDCLVHKTFTFYSIDFISLGSQGLNDRPWANYFRNPRLTLSNAVDPRVYQPEKTGKGWGFLCPVVEDATTGAILELCAEEWLGHGTEAVGKEFQYTHVVECRAPSAEFPHSVDKLAIPLPETEELVNTFGVPIEVFPKHEAEAAFNATFAVPDLKGFVELDNSAFKAKELPGGRAGEPEVGSGCGRASSSDASQWALIGIANGLEEWESREAGEVLLPSIVQTNYEPHVIEIPNESASGITETSATVTGTINPYGVPTNYVVEAEGGGSIWTTPETPVGTSLAPTPISVPLTGLKPHTPYAYRIKAFHPGIAEPAVYAGYRTFTTPPFQCTGINISGKGSSLQRLAQVESWGVEFNKSTNVLACAGTQGSHGKPTVKYSSTGSGVGLRSWGEEPKEPSEVNFGPANAYVGTDEPPNKKQKEEIESHGASGTLQTIPVAQAAVAIVVHLPAGCTSVTSGPSPGRLAVKESTLEKVFGGEITVWSKALNGAKLSGGAECNNEAAIKRVVRGDNSGTTEIVKRFLRVISAKELEPGKTWTQFAEPANNTLWPAEAGQPVIRGEGSTGVAEAVATTPGTFGYVDLADARANGHFSPPSGGEGKALFWVTVENRSSPTITYADPSTNGDATSKASANCEETVYTNGSRKFPPIGTAEPWSEVTTAKTQKNYPVCGLTYDLSLSKFSSFTTAKGSKEATRAEEEQTIFDYLYFALATGPGGGQTLISENRDYMGLPTSPEAKADVLKLAREGAAAIAY